MICNGRTIGPRVPMLHLCLLVREICTAFQLLNCGMQAHNAFCAVRPPGHHAGPTGIAEFERQPHGSHGFCLLNNLAIGAAYAMSQYRNKGVPWALSSPCPAY